MVVIPHKHGKGETIRRIFEALGIEVVFTVQNNIGKCQIHIKNGCKRQPKCKTCQRLTLEQLHVHFYKMQGRISNRAIIRKNIRNSTRDKQRHRVSSLQRNWECWWLHQHYHGNIQNTKLLTKRNDSGIGTPINSKQRQYCEFDAQMKLDMNSHFPKIFSTLQLSFVSINKLKWSLLYLQFWLQLII